MNPLDFSHKILLSTLSSYPNIHNYRPRGEPTVMGLPPSTLLLEGGGRVAVCHTLGKTLGPSPASATY